MLAGRRAARPVAKMRACQTGAGAGVPERTAPHFEKGKTSGSVETGLLWNGNAQIGVRQKSSRLHIQQRTAMDGQQPAQLKYSAEVHRASNHQ